METNYLDLLVDLIIENSRLSYDNEKLTIYDDNTVMQVIKIIAKEKYQDRFNKLKETKED